MEKSIKILVTGADGFIGKNLVAELRNQGYGNIIKFDRRNSIDDLEVACEQCEFVFHLAGVNRPKDNSEFMEGNYGLTSTLLQSLKRYDNKSPIVMSSSIQATLDNEYGASKKAGEDLLVKYGNETGSSVYIYRLPNVFGKWGKPNYNSVIATFCYNVSRNLPIQVSNPDVVLNLVYIDDVVNSMIDLIEKDIKAVNYIDIENVFQVKLQNIADLIMSFRVSRKTKYIPNMSDSFEKKLYSTYLSYLPTDDFSYELKMNVDNRGSFTEILKTVERGQVSVNISKPGITKGNHWHNTKNEKFLVVSGKGVIRFRDIHSEEIIEYYVSGNKLEVIDIPVGYTHNIENLGETDLVTIMWVNEVFDPNNPDTFYDEV